MDILTPEERSERMAKVRQRDTSPERRVRSMLHALGFRFRLHRRDLPGTPDIVLPSRRKAIFVHGCFWHGHDCRAGRLPTSNREFWSAKIDANRQRDARADEGLRALGWAPITIWQCELRDPDLAERLAAALRAPP